MPYLEDRLVPVQPWELYPRQLFSWFDMIQFSANAFFWCGRALRSIKGDCIVSSGVCVEGEVMYAMPHELDEQARQRALSHLPGVEKQFRNIGLNITADTVKELAEEIPNGLRHSFQWLHDRIEGIERLAEKELKGKFFLYITPERANFWPKMEEPYLFGKEVADKFPSATYDIGFSGVAMATTLSTASVFHLMRFMEIGLAALGKVFSVSLAHTNWEPALDEIESKIGKMRSDPTWKALPDYKEQQEYYSQAASHFRTVKNAWRNYTMHVRAKYTEDEAEQIFNSVKGFMQKLAERLSE